MKPSTFFSGFFALVLAFSASDAHAYLGIPFLTPASPTTSTPITVNVQSGYCHGFEDQKDQLNSVGPGQLQLVVDGISATNGLFCTLPEGMNRFDIGTLPAGSYTLELVLVDTESSYVDQIISVGTISFIVTEPTAVPVSSPAGAAVLGVLLILAAGFRRQHGRSR